jgi:hypothetical protein
VFNKNHTIGGPPWPDPLAPAVPTSPVRSASSAGPLHYRATPTTFPLAVARAGLVISVWCTSLIRPSGKP